MSTKYIRLLAASTIIILAMILVGLGRDSFVTAIGAMAAGYLFGKSDAL